MAMGLLGLWEMARAFQGSRILLTAVELGVFATLGDGPKASAAVAEQLKTDPRATDRLMGALVALGILHKDRDLFRNGEDAQEFLVPGKPGYAGGALMHAVNMWDSWSTLTGAVRAGMSVFERTEQERADWVIPFITAMHCNASALAPGIVSMIDLEGVRRVLDIGGGSGAYSIAFCRAKPELQSVVFDLPDVVPLTQKFVAEAGLSDRISTTAGDFNKDELGFGFDLALLSQILHSNSPEENQELIRKCFRALNPGGRIVVQDFVMDESRTSPPRGAVFALNMLVATRAGDTYTESEIRKWFENASFVDAVRVDSSGGTTLMVARKA